MDEVGSVIDHAGNAIVRASLGRREVGASSRRSAIYQHVTRPSAKARSRRSGKRDRRAPGPLGPDGHDVELWDGGRNVAT